jgi:predicted ATP-binding protein involved in virulence
MAKKVVKSSVSRDEIKNAPAAYFKNLTLENVKCFKGEHTIDLSDGNGKPANWTVILGNNNTGKTTILTALVRLSAVETNKPLYQYKNFIKNTDLDNVEEWILQLFLSEKLGRIKAKDILIQIHNILTSGLLPDINGFEIKSEGDGAIFENFVLFDTDYGKVRLRDLGYGYQSMMAWVLDLVRRMVERYPDSKSPLEEPAIVLVDEIDLHLHPEWQRKIIAHLTKYFPNTQFIVTAHSPLIVQSSDNINVVILRKEGDHTIIEQPKIRNFKGWTVEEILSDLMDLDGKTRSETYLDLINTFTQSIKNDDFEKSKNAYKELDKILHPRSELRKLFRLEMTSLTPLVSAL